MSDIAILWDFDGTLVDTGKLWRDSEYGFLEARGHRWNEDASKRLVGGNLDLVAEIFEEVTGVRFTLDELQQDFVGRVEIALGQDVPWMPGALPLLREQHTRKIRSALVTSSYQSLVSRALDRLGFAPFETIVTRDDVVRPKPDPEPYALALQRLGIHGSRTLVLEDSASGVLSASRAGCHVLAIGEHTATSRQNRVDTLEDVTLDTLLGRYTDLSG